MLEEAKFRKVVQKVENVDTTVDSCSNYAAKVSSLEIGAHYLIKFPVTQDLHNNNFSLSIMTIIIRIRLLLSLFGIINSVSLGTLSYNT